MPYWTKDHDVPILKSKIQECLLELASAGRDTYDTYSKVILKGFEAEYGTKYGWFEHATYSACLKRLM
jgi:hypothetical protein